MTLYFECHVTCLPTEPEDVDRIATEHGFKTSVLVGDPVLGDARYVYCTAHGPSYDLLLGRMRALVADLPAALVVRRKMEQVLLDER